MHNLGYAHLDIKPDNFIVNDDKSISFIDFGFTNHLHQTIRKIVGTKSYLAPEIQPKRGFEAEKADIYALGKTINILMKANSSGLGTYE